MKDFRASKIFAEITTALDNENITDIYFEETDSKYERILCVGNFRVGTIKIKNDQIDCCDAEVSFDFYLKEDEGKFEKFISALIRLSNARFENS